MAPVLLLLATHVALALNSNRYNSTETSIKQEHVNHMQKENFPPENITYLNKGSINGTPHDYELQTWRTVSTAFRTNNKVTNFKELLLNETKKGDIYKFTTQQTYNKYIDPRFVSDEPPTTTVNSIKLAKADYKDENNKTKEEMPRPPESTTNAYYYQDLNNGYNTTYTNLNKHLKPLIKSGKRENVKLREGIIGNRSRGINKKEILTKTTRNCSLENKDPEKSNFHCVNEENLIKSSTFDENGLGNWIKQSELQRGAPTNSPFSSLSKLMNVLKPKSVRFDKTQTDTTRNSRVGTTVQETSTTPYTINETQIEGTKDAHRQQNRSISPELIGTGLRFKSAVIKRAHSPSTNQSTPSARGSANDTVALFNTGLEHPLGTTNSFVITNHQELLNDNVSRETHSSRHVFEASDNQVSCWFQMGI